MVSIMICWSWLMIARISCCTPGVLASSGVTQSGIEGWARARSIMPWSISPSGLSTIWWPIASGTSSDTPGMFSCSWVSASSYIE